MAAPDTIQPWVSYQFFAIPCEEKVAHTLTLVRERGKDFVAQSSYLYVRDKAGKLVGVIQVRDLLVTDPEVQIEKIMKPSVVSVPESATQDEVVSIFRSSAFSALPVLDQAGRLIGVIARAQVAHRLPPREGEASPLGKLNQISREEIEQRKIFEIVRRRLPWLAMTIPTGLICSYILGIFIGPMESIVAFVFFLPVVFGFSGSIGTQMGQIVSRSLEAGRLNLTDLLRIWIKVSTIGALFGLIAFGLIALISLLWQKAPVMGMALGLAIFSGMVMSAFLGVVITIAFKVLKLDKWGGAQLFLLVFCDIVSAVLYFLISIGLMGTSIQLM